MAAVQVVQLAPAFWGEQAVYGPHYRGGLAPPPDWWAQAAQACALSQYQVAALQQLFQPCRWQTFNGFSYQPIQPTPPMMQMATPHYTSPAPPTPAPSPTQQAYPQALHPAPAASIPTSAPTSSPKSPAQPSWADLSEDLTSPSLNEELPTLLPKPSKGNGKGKGKTAKKSSKGTGKGRNGGMWHANYSDYSWKYQSYQYCGWY
ncbi:unnamed protein product [Symbiodinium sp. CCMP2592]|nr:unnamed protein product [Symbiodinium sp. CCMP2592]